MWVNPIIEGYVTKGVSANISWFFKILFQITTFGKLTIFCEHA